MIQETVYFQDISLFYHSVFYDTFFQKIHHLSSVSVTRPSSLSSSLSPNTLNTLHKMKELIHASSEPPIQEPERNGEHQCHTVPQDAITAITATSNHKQCVRESSDCQKQGIAECGRGPVFSYRAVSGNT